MGPLIVLLVAACTRVGRFRVQAPLMEWGDDLVKVLLSLTGRLRRQVGRYFVVVCPPVSLTFV